MTSAISQMIAPSLSRCRRQLFINKQANEGPERTARLSQATEQSLSKAADPAARFQRAAIVALELRLRIN